MTKKYVKKFSNVNTSELREVIKLLDKEITEMKNAPVKAGNDFIEKLKKNTAIYKVHCLGNDYKAQITNHEFDVTVFVKRVQ